jgi:competence protein ComGC
MNYKKTRKTQQGLSLIGVLFIGLIVVVLLLLGAKLVPAIVEYIAIERAVQKVKNEGQTVGQIRDAFTRYATIDDIKSISARDLDITKEGDRVVISYAYTYSIPVMDNVRIVIDFSGTTRDRASKAVP